MSSLFNKSTGINLASVLGSNSCSQTGSIASISNNNNSLGSSSNLLANKIAATTRTNNHNFNTNNINNNNNSQQKILNHLNSSSINSPDLASNSNISCANNNNISQSLNRKPLTSNYLKTIDSCLEEATRTGDLLLGNKSLIEFPSTIAFKYDLTDTLTVDLSRNRLSELPKDVLRYKPLEKLIINSNIIRSIPEISTNQLKCIRTLDLNCNRLCYLPASLCNLVSLEILTVNNNKLVSLPEEIGRLEKLIQLDVSCNEITHLPIQMGEMTSLRSLNVRRNLLVELPKEISQLKLVNFDCTSNRISKLPLCFREMVTLIDLLVENNPLEVPPAHICSKGLLHIMKYLLVEAIKEEKKRGILSEYEITSQFSANNNTSNQRSSCNSSNSNGGGMSSIGSFLFQSSMRNICKKFSDSSSTTSSTESTTSSVSSASQLSMKQHNSKQINTSLSNLHASNLVSKSINSISSASSSHSSSASSNAPASNLSKQNLYLNNDLNDFPDNPSQSSPSSSASSSSPVLPPLPPPPLPQSLQHNLMNSKTQAKSGSIHELLSLKTTQSQGQLNSNITTLQQQQMNYLKYNRNNSSDTLSNDFHSKTDQDNHIWRMTEPREITRKTQEELNREKSKQRLLFEQQQQQFDANFSIVTSLSSSILSPSNGSPLQSSTTNTNNNNNTNSKSLLIENKLNNSNRRLTNDYNGYDNSSRNMPINSIQQLKNNNISTPIPVVHHHQQQQQSSTDSDQLIYDESLNPIITPGFPLVETNNNEPNNDVARYYQQQQQQVWIPRDDLSSNDLKGFNHHHFTPVEPISNNINNMKEVPNELNTAFTVRRHLIQIEQEQKQCDSLRKAIESKLKIQLPITRTVEELANYLSDGVVLCHLMNHVFPRAIQMIHLPSLSMPKLSPAKCRKNVENFIDACRRIGIDENEMCCVNDIMESKNVLNIVRTVILLVNLNQQQIEPKFSLSSPSAQPIYEYRPQITIGNAMNGNNNPSNLQIPPLQQQQQQTAV